MSKFALAVDIGATKAALATVAEDFQILEKIEIPTGNNSDIWRNIEIKTKSLLQSTPGELIGVGIGSAGPLNLSKGEVSPVNIPNWRNFQIVKNFSELTGSSNVVLHGDAMALAHAEFKLGAGRGAENMFGLVVSTGVGGGLILNGKLFTGVSGNASYFGHHSISFEGKECECGRSGCVEAFASGPKMVEHAKELGWLNESYDFKSLAEDARNGDKSAIASIDRGSKALANAIINVLEILDINIVVVGGGVSEAGEIYWEPLRYHVRELAKFAGFLDHVDLRAARLDRNAGLIGAALGVLDESR